MTRHTCNIWRAAAMALCAILTAMAGWCGYAEEAAPAAAPAPSDAAAPAPDAAEGATPELVARVGEGDGVTKAEFDEMVAKLLQAQAAQGRARGQAVPTGMTYEQKKRLLDQMVDTKVIDLLAKEAGCTVADADVQAKVDDLKSKLSAAGRSLEEALEQEGMTLAKLKEMLGQQMVRTKFLEGKAEEVTVSPAEIEEFYGRLKEAGRLEQPESVDVAHILVRVPQGSDEATWDEAKAKIDAARKRVVEGGEDFGAVAKEVSDDPGSKDKGGKYEGVTLASQYVQPFKDASFATAVGEVSEPFKTQFGWHILTVDVKHEARTSTLEDESEKIERSLKQQKVQEAIQQLIADGREKMKVEILLQPEPGEEEGAAGQDAGALLEQAS
ncbi:MAG: peptidylprolyl isomerase [Candidatus Hydrogenedentes bacterium]|nr:peptidylprolyl isomerase [Candidatus Hydrogenedentota bacterium]